MDFEIDAETGYNYGNASNTAFYEIMLAQHAAELTAGTAAPDDDPGLLWLTFEGIARSDARIDWSSHRGALAGNRWVPILYELDEDSGLGDVPIDDDYDPALFDEDSLAGCRTRLIGLLMLADGPGVTENFDLVELARDIHATTGGYDPLALARSELLLLAEGRRRAAH
ncbi:hypothetical protein [Tomitella fengzijianii]|uniref:Uncharacterized protein n=1 Tax=Tomitella fengzijianii TaxID=2597660 RepID=A0A516X3Z4_9ACTN|nr:hypothetical protein [Tomitella fengzijianii]QDQ97774.1 hypothetical protein FO059_11155 [Tomitella fengzijianii]